VFSEGQCVQQLPIVLCMGIPLAGLSTETAYKLPLLLRPQKSPNWINTRYTHTYDSNPVTEMVRRILQRTDILYQLLYS
jgi:hypothetical protein